MTGWERHWGLVHDPFRAHSPPFVPTPGALEALDRLGQALEAAEPWIRVTGEPGVGKTTVLARALAVSRRPGQRLVLMSGLCDPAVGLEILGRKLGIGLSGLARLADPWARLERALATAGLERARIVVAIDDATDDVTDDQAPWIGRLVRMGARAGVTLSVVEARSHDQGCCTPSPDGCSSIGAVRVLPLTRDEAEEFVRAKLAGAGCRSALFTPRAITRLHGLAMGLPGGLERLATASLRAAARAGLEITTPEIIDAAALGELEPAMG